MAIVIWGVAGCDLTAHNNSGVYVLFAGQPNIHDRQVYFNSQAVGDITGQEVKGSAITRLTIALAPEFKRRAKDNWAFYVDGGRLMAIRLPGSGAPLTDGDKLCGFSTKAAFNWFRFKTLLGDRAYKAGKRAEYLFKRFNYS